MTAGGAKGSPTVTRLPWLRLRGDERAHIRSDGQLFETGCTGVVQSIVDHHIVVLPLPGDLELVKGTFQPFVRNLASDVVAEWLLSDLLCS